MILVIGATGKTGSNVVKNLLDKNCSVRALVRSEEKARALRDAGVDVIIGDVSSKDLVHKAMDKVTKVFLLLPNGQDQLTLEKNVIDAAVEAKVSLFVKQSSLESVEGTTKPIPKMHLASEAYLKSCGLNWVMIRPTFFAQMLLTCAPAIRARDALTFPMGLGKVAATDARDVAEVVAKVLTEDGHENKSYDLTGPELLSFEEIAHIFTEVLGRKISYVDQPLADYRGILEKFIPDAWRVSAVCEELKGLADGSTQHTTQVIQILLGREPRSVRQFLTEYAKAFSPD
ncbi:SDR family oxidoreductase [Aliiglaciecola sp. 3_MG-2023]|uniref:SDR family oxidoreductase n=1 Tax=Aliiglaciecola sp. 3_MG-2023 TaxID=3062644 RepID=UPI0026E1DA67|nr:SDR family oxidoreductase [Aliiglaciecola sp. 3_MG-2023]MDO6693103.1 SDR family oxidoreductase [Aliiglaciecola sp. 3_MG-2023]